MKLITICFIGALTTGTVFNQLKTWTRSSERNKELFNALVIYLTLAILIALLALTVWRGPE
jgi:hypothetical protein